MNVFYRLQFAATGTAAIPAVAAAAMAVGTTMSLPHAPVRIVVKICTLSEGDVFLSH